MSDLENYFRDHSDGELAGILSRARLSLKHYQTMQELSTDDHARDVAARLVGWQQDFIANAQAVYDARLQAHETGMGLNRQEPDRDHVRILT